MSERRKLIWKWIKWIGSVLGALAGIIVAYLIFIWEKPPHVSVVPKKSKAGVTQLYAKIDKLESNQTYLGLHWKWKLQQEGKESPIYETPIGLYDPEVFDMDPDKFGFGTFTATATFRTGDGNFSTFSFMPDIPFGIKVADGDIIKNEKNRIITDLSGGISLENAHPNFYEIDFWKVEGEVERVERKERIIRQFDPQIKEVTVYVQAHVVETTTKVSIELVLAQVENEPQIDAQKETIKDIEIDSEDSDEDTLNIVVPSLKSLQAINKEKLIELLVDYSNSKSDQEFYRNELDLLAVVTNENIPVAGYYSLSDLLTRMKMSFDSPVRIQDIEFEVTKSNRIKAITRLDIIDN